MSDRGSARRAQKIDYRRIIDHFEQIARANVGKYMHVGDICRVARINERTLSRAYRELRNVGPRQYVLSLRLSEVRRVLLSEDGTVTQAAMRFGFRELGKFGVLYRRAFGETPSQTKRRRRSMDANVLEGSPDRCDIFRSPGPRDITGSAA
jgi:transcriptional regulator GlxA family with amidase domain